MLTLVNIVFSRLAWLAATRKVSLLSVVVHGVFAIDDVCWQRVVGFMVE